MQRGLELIVHCPCFFKGHNFVFPARTLHDTQVIISWLPWLTPTIPAPMKLRQWITWVWGHIVSTRPTSAINSKTLSQTITTSKQSYNNKTHCGLWESEMVSFQWKPRQGALRILGKWGGGLSPGRWAWKNDACQRERFSVWVGLGVGFEVNLWMEVGLNPKGFARRIESNFLLCLVLNWDLAEQHEPPISLILSKESHCKTSAFLNLIWI